MTLHFDKIDNSFATTSSPFGVVVVPGRSGLYRNGLKRALDMMLVVLSAPVSLTATLILALFIARDGHRPFYWSDRVGRNGRTFRMLKLRTMVPGADELLEKHLASNPDAREEWLSTQKLKRDPRITRVGHFLRKTSLDELPQVWNVLVGDMSLVGPRPMLPQQRSLYPGLAYYALRPGMTGPWQVSDRNDSEFAKRAEFDRKYDENLSLGVDLHCMFKTALVVIKGTGY